MQISALLLSEENKLNEAVDNRQKTLFVSSKYSGGGLDFFVSNVKVNFLTVINHDFSGCIDIFEDNVDYLESVSGHSKVEMQFSYGNEYCINLSVIEILPTPGTLAFLRASEA